MFSNSLGSLSRPMQWPSEIGYPKVRQSERFWTIIRMLIFSSIIFGIAIVIISTIQEEGSWTDIPGLPPSPAQVAPAFGDSGLLEVGPTLPLGIRSFFFQFLILESFEIGEIINSFSCQESQPKYSKRAFHQYITYFSSFSPGSQTYCGFTLQCDFSSW